MNKPSGNGSGLYHVAYSDQVQSAFKELLKKAREKGILREVLAAAKAIDKRLHRDPMEFGEPHGNLKQGKGQLRSGFVRPLAVVYAVYEEDRKVLVTRPIYPLPECGL